MKAVIESAGAVGSRVTVGNHELAFDQPATVPGGQDRGPSPLDVMAVSVGACAHYFAAAFLLGRKLATDELRVEVTFEKTKDPVPRLGLLEIRVRLPPGVPAHYLPAIERAVRHCPAYGTLVHPPDVKVSFEASPASVSAA